MPTVQLAEDTAAKVRALAEDYLLASGFVPGEEVPRLAWQLALFVSSAQLRALSVEPLVLSQSLHLLATLARSGSIGTVARSKTPLSPLPSSRIVPNLRN